MDLSPEAITAYGTALGVAIVYVVNRIRERSRNRTATRTVTVTTQFDRQWVQRMEDHAKRSHELANDISRIAYRIGQVEKWKDGHDAETHKGYERLAVVEHQFKTLVDSQDRTNEMLEKMFTLLENDLKDARDRLARLEAEGRRDR